jgi:hypothetical protein
MKTKKQPGIFREIFSGANGKLSAKRVLGGIALFIALGCTIYLVIIENGSNVVENLLMTILIMAASLLGLPAVTGMWNKSSMSIGSQPTSDEESIETIESEPTNQCDKCCKISCNECPFKEWYNRPSNNESIN